MEIPKRIITIPAKAEVNDGPSEDSDSMVLHKPFRALVVGPVANGALPVKILGEDGKPEDQVRFFHQPPPRRSKI